MCAATSDVRVKTTSTGTPVRVLQVFEKILFTVRVDVSLDDGVGVIGGGFVVGGARAGRIESDSREVVFLASVGDDGDVVAVFRAKPRAKFTVRITHERTRLLEKYEFSDVVVHDAKRFRDGVRLSLIRGQTHVARSLGI